MYPQGRIIEPHFLKEIILHNFIRDTAINKYLRDIKVSDCDCYH